MNENQVMAKAIRTFHGEEGPKNPASDPFPVSRARFADLAANNLVIDASATADPSVSDEPGADVKTSESLASEAGDAVGAESDEATEPKAARVTRAK